MLSRYHLELAFAGFVFLIGVVGILGSRELEIAWAARGPQAGFFPFRVSLVLMVASALVAIVAFRDRARLSTIEVASGEGARRIAAFALPAIGLVLVAQWLGLYVATALYLAVAVGLIARRSLPTTLLVALGVPVAAYVLFEVWFKVPLLKGPLEIALGLG